MVMTQENYVWFDQLVDTLCNEAKFGEDALLLIFFLGDF